MKPERMSIAEAARMLGVPKQHLRIGLQRGRYKFGEAFKGTGEGYIYYISRSRLEAYLKGRLQ